MPQDETIDLERILLELRGFGQEKKSSLMKQTPDWTSLKS